ncbi:MAG: GDSL-type esterase/lipase family protein [Rikenellaceae bacterium]
MKFNKFALTLVFVVLSAPLFSQIKVACIGNSITFGAGVVNRELNSYPAQLQGYLGDEYEVYNFGVSGTTVLSKGDKPYIKTEEYKKSLELKPDIVLIKLGTNDSKIHNIEHFADFDDDYHDIIKSYQDANPKARIILMTPVRCYQDDETKISNDRIREKIAPAIEKLAYDNSLEIFDTYSLFGEEYKEAVFPDKIHPSSIGAGIMAMNLYRYLTLDRDKVFNIFGLISTEGQHFNFHGYQGQLYIIDNVAFKIVRPKFANNKRTWVLRARFWDHEPQLDIKLLELGYHLIYYGVEDLYGSDEAVSRFDGAHRRATLFGLSETVVLEGMSRGGLPVYNWAAKNPKKVSAIYADAPVMDLKSWPLGEGKSAGSETDTQKMMKAYGMKSKDDVLKYKKNPIDNAKVFAKYETPILHVVGEEDEVVPVDENTAIFAERLRAEGHDMTIISKPGVGHHPHSLSAPEQILRFILKADGLFENHCVVPVRGYEYRAAAGWLKGADWNAVAEDITVTLKKQHVDILMLGNSITQGTNRNRALTAGNRDLTPYFKEYSWESAGISGDKTQNLLWRIQTGEYNSATPKYVTIAIGVNNLGADDDAPSTLEGILAVTEAAKIEFPNSKIILFGLLPTMSTEKRLEDYYTIQSELKKLDLGEQVTYVDPTPHFTDEEGKPRTDLYRPDMIHLIDKGYEVWCNLIYDTIKGVTRD